MPARDGTGPLGQGPMTGRGAGFCTGYAAFGFGRGRGIGRGLGRGHGFWGYMPWNWGGIPNYSNKPTPEDLKGELSYLENIQKSIIDQITEIKNMLSKKEEK